MALGVWLQGTSHVKTSVHGKLVNFHAVRMLFFGFSHNLSVDSGRAHAVPSAPSSQWMAFGEWWQEKHHVERDWAQYVGCMSSGFKVLCPGFSRNLSMDVDRAQAVPSDSPRPRLSG